MMGRQTRGQEQLFYAFSLEEVVPADHLVRRIDAVLDTSWVHRELAPFYSTLGRPSVDPELMIRMLIVGYVFAIRSEREICRDVQVNLAYRWFCGLGLEDRISPDRRRRLSPVPYVKACKTIQRSKGLLQRRLHCRDRTEHGQTQPSTSISNAPYKSAPHAVTTFATQSAEIGNTCIKCSLLNTKLTTIQQPPIL